MKSSSKNAKEHEALESSIVRLPITTDTTATFLDVLTNEMGVKRSVLPSDEQISFLWSNLPRLLSTTSRETVTDTHVKMCTAIAAGLFDGAINYAWILAVTSLRDRVTQYGLRVVSQVISDPDFDERKLLQVRDADLIQLCHNLNLISEDAHFRLNQCREIRNHFSAAHPPIGPLSEYEVQNFINIVLTYAWSSEENPKGIDILELIRAIKNGRFSEEQMRHWQERIERTHAAQRALIFRMLHGVHCDPSEREHSRVNALEICKGTVEPYFSQGVKSALINQHSEYTAKGDTERQTKSRLFFEQLGLLHLLDESERHVIVSNACRNLMRVHQAWNNFHNEAPFAERLYEVVSQQQVPDTAKPEFIETVVTCSVGNAYGTSYDADVLYLKMVKGFSAKEIEIMLKLPQQRNLLSERMKQYPRCKDEFRKLVSSLDIASIPASLQTSYNRWVTA